MGYKKILDKLLLFIVLFYNTVQAQNFPYKHYTTDNGLANASVYLSYQDSKGFMWFGTENGISRFDGNTFKNYTIANGLPGNTIMSITEDNNHRIYVGTKAQGIAVYYNDSFRVVYADSLAIQQNLFLKIAHGQGYSLNLADVANLTDFRNQRTIQLQTNHVIKSRLTHHLHAINILKDSTILVCSAIGLYKIQNNSLVYIDIPKLVDKPIYSSFEKGDTVFLGLNRLIYKMVNWKIVDSIEIKGQDQSEINSILVDRNNSIWLTTRGSSVLFIKNKVIYDFNRMFKLDYMQLTFLYEDKEGNIWLGTNNDGVYCINHSYLSITPETCPVYKSYITRFCGLNRNNVLIGTTVGLYMYAKRESSYKRVLYSRDGVRPYYVQFLEVLDSNNVIVSEVGQGQQSVVKHFKVDNVNYSVFHNAATIAYSNGNYLCSDFHGRPYIAVANDTNLQKAHIFDLMPAYNSIKTKSFFKIADNLTFIGTTKGLFSIDERLKLTRYRGKILESSINCILKRNNEEIWFGTNQGIAIKRNNSWTYITEIDGVYLKSVSDIAFDNSGDTWIATLSGLYNLRKSVLRQIDLSLLLPSDQINALLFDNNDNTLLLGTTKGIATLDIDAYRKVTYSPPNVIILGINSPNHKYKLDGELLFPYTDRSFNISFTAVSLRLSHQLLFQYSIDGEIWTETPGRILQLINEPYGKHKLLLRCGFGNNEWSTPTVMNFIIQTPFWATGWFKSFLCLIGIGFLVLVVWWRIDNLRKANIKQLTFNNRINELRQQALAASMNPHFVFNSLNSIQHFINSKEPQEASDYLGKFARLIRKTVDLSGEAFITLKEEIDRLGSYLELEKMRLDDVLSYNIDVEKGIDVDKFVLPNMIIQPFVENAIWHGILASHHAGKVIVSFKDEINYIRVEIEDDGIGYKKSIKKKNHISKGLSIVIERLISIMPELASDDIVKMIDLSEENPELSGTRVIVRFSKVTLKKASV